MLRYILNNLAGYLRIRVEGYSPERFLNLCCYHGIFLWNLRPAKGAYEMNIRVRDFRRLRPMVRKSRAKVRIIQKRGVPFFIHKYRGRKLFFTGSVIAICLIFLLSSFIWRIQIDGNLARTDEVLLSFLTEKGIACGIAKKNVDCDRIEKDIRMEYDDIIWVSAYVHGSCLKIKVRENPDRKELQTEAEAEAPMDIVAEADGIIQKIITRKGNPLVREGSEVKKGEILVSGSVEVKNDSDEVTGYQYRVSDADIIAQTTVAYTDILDRMHPVWKDTGKKSWRFWIETPERLYLFGRRELPYPEYNALTCRYILYLERHFPFPVSVRVERSKESRKEEISYTDREAREILSYNFEKFCARLEKKGVQISENDVKIYRETNRYSAKGKLVLSGPFGIVQKGTVHELPKADAENIQQEGN